MTANDTKAERPGGDHAEVQALLPEYVDLAVQGRDPEPVFSAITRHLAECDDCYQIFVDLLQMAAISDSEPVAAAAWTPDLSFLRPPAEAEPPAKPAAPLVVRPSPGEILIAYTRAIVDAFTQPQLAGALRGQLIHRALHKIPGTPPVDVTVEISAKDTLCTVEIHLYLHDRSSLQQEGTLVRLQAGALAQEASSDGMGRVSFQDMPLEVLPLLRLTIITG